MLKSLPRGLQLAAAALVLLSFRTDTHGAPAYDRKADVIYGRKYGLALTMDVLRPKEKANGRGVILVMSGGWFSGPPNGNLSPWAGPLVESGYTIFQVVHGSQPKFAIPEILEDMHRAVRYIRYHAKDYGIDPERIGILGGSAGGHLSLMQGTAGHDGRPESKDPVDRMSSRVQAVACFFPPTDFLNYGEPGKDAIGRGTLEKFAAAFDFREFDREKYKFVTITDEARIVEIGRKISPITHVSEKSAPALIVHGDKDLLVPIQQAESLIEKLKAAGVAAKLIVKPGAAHGWPGMEEYGDDFVEWFETHLKAQTSAE